MFRPMAFHCVIVTPEHQILDERVSQVILPAHDGEMGILSGRAPILVKLGVGRLRVDVAGGRSASFFVDGGVAQMKDDRLTVLTDDAVPVEELDPAAARTEMDAATALAADTPAAAAERNHAIERARAKQRLAAR
jgi:F-type H+-transporting ATPase subunit epsilon